MESGFLEPVIVFGRIWNSAAYAFCEILRLLRKVKHFINFT